MANIHPLQRIKRLKWRINKALNHLSSLRDMTNFKTYYKDIPSTVSDIGQALIKLANSKAENVLVTLVEYGKNEDTTYSASKYKGSDYIEFEGGTCATSMNSCFENSSCIKIDNLDTTATTSFSATFKNASGLMTISSLPTLVSPTVTNISEIFYKCYLLNIEGIEDWNMQNVSIANYAFFDTTKYLKKLDLTRWQVPNLTDARYMFANNGAEDIDMTDVDFSKCTDSEYMFTSCKNLRTISLPSNLPSANCLLQECIQLQAVNNLNKAFAKGLPESFTHTFENTAVTEIYLEGIDTSSVTSLDYCFSMCKELLSLKMGHPDNCKSLQCTFQAVTKLDFEFIKYWDLSKVTNWNSAFSAAKVSFNILNHLNLSSATDITKAFQKCNTPLSEESTVYAPNCNSISLAFAEYKTKKLNITLSEDTIASNKIFMQIYCTTLNILRPITVQSLYEGFRGSTNLTAIPLDKISFDDPAAVSWYYAFYNCSSLLTLSDENLEITVIGASNMLYSCINITSVYLPKVTLTRLVDRCFGYSNKLTNLTFKKIDFTDSPTSIYGFLSDNKSITHIDAKFVGLKDTRILAAKTAPLDRETILKIIDGLWDYSNESNNHELQISQISYNYLQDEDFNLAYEKGWELSC